MHQCLSLEKHALYIQLKLQNFIWSMTNVLQSLPQDHKCYEGSSDLTNLTKVSCSFPQSLHIKSRIVL